MQRSSDGVVHRKIRLRVVATHPIQNQAPLYRHLARSKIVDLTVVFLTDFGTKSSFDPGFDRYLAFDTALLDGYHHHFLTRDVTRRPSRGVLPSMAFWPEVSSRQTDIVLVHGYATAMAWGTCLAAAAFGTPYMIRGDSRWETDIARGAIRRSAKRLLIGPLLRRAGACVAIGESNRNFYRSYGVAERHIVTAPFSVDTDHFTREGAEGRARRDQMLQSAGLDPALPTLCFAAKLQPHKRPLDVFGAVGLMARPVNLIVIGDGPLRADVDEAAARLQRTKVLGFLNQSVIGRWYGASDVIVLPSSSEPWGLVVNEAMATGAVPVVSSAAGCAPDLVTRSGAVYPVGDVAALADALDRVVADSVALEESRAQSRSVAAAYSVAATARGYEDAAVVAHVSRRGRRRSASRS